MMILLAAAALTLIGAAPVSAAPGGVPGPPADHGKSVDHKVKTADDGEEPTSNVPDWAKAYGKRIIDEFGTTYGHLQQCAGVASDSDDSDADQVSDTDGDASRPNLECPVDLEFPEDGNGAVGFWVFTQMGTVIVGL